MIVKVHSACLWSSVSKVHEWLLRNTDIFSKINHIPPLQWEIPWRGNSD